MEKTNDKIHENQIPDLVKAVSLIFMLIAVGTVVHMLNFSPFVNSVLKVFIVIVLGNMSYLGFKDIWKNKKDGLISMNVSYGGILTIGFLAKSVGYIFIGMLGLIVINIVFHLFKNQVK